ncbi:RHNO1 protein, partial [Turnix velox]|nr:RHNO1 protein [Turnix velox]
MPPKKKRISKSRKAELIFLERPPEGLVHWDETLLPSVKNPRRVPTKPIDQNTSAAWVCPEFDTTKSVVWKACQKKHCGPHKPQNREANHSSLHAGGTCRGAIACKFPPLIFEKPEGDSICPGSSPNHSSKSIQHSSGHPKKGTASKVNIQVNRWEKCTEIPLLPAPQHVEPEVFSLPGVDAPQVPSIRNNEKWSTLPQSTSHAQQPENELPDGIDPCGRRESTAVLVTDTPEHEYGIKVTWRRRRHLMQYLQERG